MAVSGKKAPAVSTGSGEDFEIFCQPCDLDDIRLPAFGYCTNCEEHLCESCFNHHKKPKPLRHHILLDKQNMPQTQQIPSKSTHAGQPDDLTTPCTEHKREIIKFYCHDHKVLLCTVCVTLGHSLTSCHVNYIPDISKQSINSSEYRDTIKDIDNIAERYHKLTEDLRRMTTNSNNSLSDVLIDLKKFRKEINQRLDELEKEAEDRANALKDDNNKRLTAMETASENITKCLKASTDSIKQLNTSKQADRLFMELKSAQKLIEVSKEKLSLQAPHADVNKYQFQPNLAISSFLKEKSLGTIRQKAKEQSNPPPVVSLQPLKYSHQGSVSVKTTQDKNMCYVTGMALLTPSKLVLTDYNNQSIKMIDTNSNSISHQLKPETAPGDLTLVTRDQLAVTLPGKNKIQFVSASSNKLSLKHTFKVDDGFCNGLSCYQEKLVVSFVKPSKLQIIDLNGKVLKTIITNSKGEDIFTWPNFVTSNSHSIYVSDESRPALIRLNWHGKLRGIYKAIQRPTGIAMLEDGSILVNNYPNGDIQHLSCDLSKSSIVLKDLTKPFAICCSGTDNKLYISLNSSEEKNDNYIQIFKMS
ncbi:uncharacterized protein LOC123547507 [Mercenaria mercenaria]|uniref:uncharacterized protein LOC123547507 n=1 Tax=Mercenaria mercenaria TaxID=6596 RepID=UPI00234F14F5|nr:uncharacterized protein LOC123547507 [Mercenaria mercenaria]